jgi:uncharacterized protein
MMHCDDSEFEEPYFLGDWVSPDHPEEINKQLIKAIEEADFNQVLEVLSRGADPNAHSEDVPLFVAVRTGKTEIVQALLEAGADPNYSDSERYTILMFAAHAGYLEIVQVLLNAGANINAMNKDGGTALSMAVWEERQGIVEYLSLLTSDENRKHADLYRNLNPERSMRQ